VDHDELVRQANAAYKVADWHALRLLYHPDCRIVSVAAGADAVLTRDELMAVLAEAATDTIYDVSFSRAETLGDDALVIVGRVRHRLGRGFADSAWHWLWTLRDGVIYRSVAYPSLDGARAAYETLGDALGLEGP
jgi:ketosteroid isomerase-like protein